MTPDSFIARWQHADGSELANAQSFVRELCELLDVPVPDPARADTRDNAYVFERRVIFRHGDGTSSEGRIDTYRRACFVLESKKLKQNAQTKGFDDGMQRARAQAENYCRALPAEEGRPPFLIVVDVGNIIEIYAEFSRSGATFTPFPDPRSYRIKLSDLHDAALRERLRQIWLEPLSLDPSRVSARVTRDISQRLAGLARELESAGHDAEAVAGFLTRCLFCMFAEDVGLLPKADGKGAFTVLLESFVQPGQAKLEQFIPLLGALWRDMDVGGFSVVLRQTLPRFNGKLFKQPQVLPLTRSQIEHLIQAALSDWTKVEPAIFGTLLERALDPAERHALGAEYTPRPYVERLILPTVINPLRAEWDNVKAAALLLSNEGKPDAARATLREFHHRLCQIRVLDPACGSANFLYVTLEHMKRLEGEVLDLLDQIGETLGDTQGRLESEGLTVDPHQFLGLELNPRAAAVAELVLWIGYLQWHFRTRGTGVANLMPPSPILKDFKNIECRDAVLAHDGVDYVIDATGLPVTRWDGRSFKPHPTTGEPVPDERAQIPQERYRNPRKAEWPPADFIVGNPPFIGASAMRAALGDGYVDALRGVWRDVPDSADFVMFWWQHAASLVRSGQVQCFGFITTNSLRQTFNRRVVEAALVEGMHLAYAIPDHPWVDSADGAAVRIAMTVGAPGGVEKSGEGRLLTVTAERETGGEGLEVELSERLGLIHADLSIGANVAAAKALRANGGISSPGFKLHGAGFIVTPEEAAQLEADAPIKPYRNGRDLTDRPRGVKLIDLFGLTAEEVRGRYPATFQRVLERVKPERDHNARATYRDNWWVFGEARKDLRPALANLPRYIATVETAKHRVFQFLDASIAPDNKLICIALDDAFSLGVLSSRVHVVWALATGSHLGVGNDPVYVKTRCFETFPFPEAAPENKTRIAALAEQLDALRKRVLAEHPDLTLTGLYNVLEKLRAMENVGRKSGFLAPSAECTAHSAEGASLFPTTEVMLTAKEKGIHQRGLVSVLRSLHDELDAEVLAAYGWEDQPNSETLLVRLTELNTRRSAEEAAGNVRWLRPDFQNPHSRSPDAAIAESGGFSGELPGFRSTPSGLQDVVMPAAKTSWPATLPEQVAAVARVLAAAAVPLSETAITAHFSGRGAWKKRLPQLLETLVALGRARVVAGAYVSE
jgi:hypothetical protein